MTPRKTELALTALQSHRSPLTLLQRRALILADGQRDLATLAVLLGGDGAALVHALCAMGYLESGTQAGSATRTAPASDSSPAGVPGTHVTQPAAPPSEEDLQRQRRRAATGSRCSCRISSRYSRALVAARRRWRCRSSSLGGAAGCVTWVPGTPAGDESDAGAVRVALPACVPDSR
ncbi:hypothetical protein [Xanthomonas arboricola]|uniref:hypothetical protein n=1 Tax=Xanthomonas arboricola TaxID=56448 RepID=UPI002157AE3D